MIFNSIEFLIFLPIVFCLFWIFPKKYRYIVLLIASYFFYIYWNWKLIILILITTLVSYLCGIGIEKTDKKQLKITILVSGLVICFGILIFFKYFSFFYDAYQDILAIFTKKRNYSYFDIMLPVGISFYTFQTAAYFIDVYKGKIKAEKHIGYYALFVSFFPQLVAGPIERSQDLLPQLKNSYSMNDIDYSSAFRYMLLGFFKKIAIADVIGIVVNNVYGNIADSTGLSILISTVLFAFQIYCDFSGYSDIAVGCAKLFGVNLTENFNHPYQSNSIKDFWERWHISLSRWLRDYIYFPLGGSRVRKIRWVLNIMIVFFVSGLWHGANYTFIIWGLLNGLFYVIGVLTLSYRNKLLTKMKINPSGRFVKVMRLIFTFLIVDFCWIFFRANTIGDVGLAISKIFSNYSFTKDYFVSSFSQMSMTYLLAIYIVVVLVALFFLENIKTHNFKKLSSFKYSTLRYLTYFCVTAFIVGSWVYLQASNVGSSFIYFQF